MKSYPKITEFQWGYFEIETQRFYFRAYKRSGGNGRCIVYRTECCAKVSEKKYCIEWSLFHELDYKDASEAFEHAKQWVLSKVQEYSNELSESLLTRANNL